MKRANRHGSRGSALVAVLCLIAVLGIASVAAVRVVAFDSDVAASHIHGFRARQLAEMGIAIASNPAVERDDPLLLQYSVEEGEGFEARITSEGEKLNINSILIRQDSPLLQTIFVDWGMTLDEAQQLIDSLIDWIDVNDEAGLNGAESEWYEAQGRVNQPFNRPFYKLDEMRLVRGMDRLEALRPNWRDWFTVWSSGPLDLNEASPELIAAVAGVSLDDASVIPKSVRGADGIRGTEDDVPFQSADQALALLGVDASVRPDISARVTVNETTTRLESVGSVAGGKRKITVIVRNRTGTPAVLERTEDVIP